MLRYRGDEAALSRRGFVRDKGTGEEAAALLLDAQAAREAGMAAYVKGDWHTAGKWGQIAVHFRDEAMTMLYGKDGAK